MRGFCCVHLLNAPNGFHTHALITVSMPAFIWISPAFHPNGLQSG